MTVVQEFGSMQLFYERRGGAGSGESDFGVMWRDIGRHFPPYRVSVVHSTGDVYAYDFHTGEVELLGTVAHNGAPGHYPPRHRDEPGPCASICAYREAERALDGWAEALSKPESLEWARARLHMWTQVPS